MIYKEWKRLKESMRQSNVLQILNFERNHPDTVASYEKRLAEEDKKKREIMNIEDNKERVRKIAENLSLFRY